MAIEKKKRKFAVASYLSMSPDYYPSNIGASQYTKVDKLAMSTPEQYKNLVNDCRYFYLKEPLASTVVNKMVDIAVNDISVSKSKGLSKTEAQIYDALKSDIIAYIKKVALELLVTGLAVPEISLTRLTKDELRQKGIQRVDSLLYPTEMYVRDSGTIEIKRPFISSKESYFLVIPDEVIFFIQNKGEYPDGTKDIKLYNEIVELYPEFVQLVLANETKILLDNPLIIKYKDLTFTPYPASYLYPGLESFKHKRNMRRMDYAVAARVISAILHVSVGSDEYPLTEDQEDVLDDLEQKFKWKENLNIDDIERVFALFTNHTVDIKWVFPEMSSLMDNKKYEDVNKDIIQSLGFPRVLITGESERSFAADPELVTLSPLATLRTVQDLLMPVVTHIFLKMRENNSDVLKTIPEFKFKPINLMSLTLLYTGLSELYQSGNLSRSSYSEAYGYDFQTEINKRKEEQDTIMELGVEEFAPVPHSNVPGNTPEKKPGAPLNNKNGEQKGKNNT